MSNVTNTDIELAAKIVVRTLRDRQAEYLAASVTTQSASLQSILRNMAESDGEIASLLESVMRHDSARKLAEATDAE